MDAEAEQHGGEVDPVPFGGPDERRGQDAQQAFGAAARADGRDHGVPEPQGGEGARLLGGDAPTAEDAEDEPPGEEVGEGEDDFAEGEEGHGGEEEPCQERGVAVGVARVGGLRVPDVAGCVGEDEVVDVCVFDGRVGVLVGAVHEERDAEEGGDEEERRWAEERCHHGHGVGDGGDATISED